MAKGVLKVLTWLGGLLLLLVVVVGALSWIVLQSQPGHDFVLRTVLNQAPSYVNGEVRIQALRSDGLLRGFTLHGVEIRDERDRPFVEADSVRVRYSIQDLLARRIVLTPADLWGARVTLETLHGDDEPNVARIFAPATPEPLDPTEEVVDDDPPGLRLVLRELAIHDSEFLLRLPLEGDEPPAQGIVETVPETEGLYQRLHFSAINGRFSEVDILSPEREGERIVIDRLSLTGQIFEDPFHLEELTGAVARVGTQLTLEADELRLPESQLSGRVGVDWGDEDGGLVLDVGLSAPVLQLADLQWLESRIPRGEGQVELSIQGPLTSSVWRLTEMDLEVAPARLRGQVGFLLEDGFIFQDTRVDVTALELAMLEPWLEEPLPFNGVLGGAMSVSGPLSALRLDGQVDFQDPTRDIPPATVAVDGILGVMDVLRAQGLSILVDPLPYPILQTFAPELEFELMGTGTAQMELSGDLQGGVALTADVTHRPAQDQWASRVLASGTVRQDGEDWILDLDGNLDPLSLDGVGAALGQDLPVAGEVSGPVRVAGGLRALSAGASLTTAAGRLEVDGVFDVLELESGYRFGGQVQDFALHQVVTTLPDPTVLTGAFLVEGSGLTLETLSGTADVEFTQVELGRVDVDELAAHLEARDGRLLVENLALRSPLGQVDGWGELGLREDSPEGELQVVWALESVEALRPVLLGDTVIAGDTLTDLERLDLQMQGIDPDTLPAAMAVAMSGDASGSLTLRGTFRDLTGEGTAEVTDLLYGDLSLGEGRIDLAGSFQGPELWSVEGRMSMDAFAFNEVGLESVEMTGAYGGGEGEARAGIRRDADEGYTLGGVFQVDSLGVDSTLDELTLDLDQVVWSLAAPANLRVAGRTLEVDDLRLTRPATDGDRPDLTMVEMGLRGILSLEEESDFQLWAQGADVHRLASILQVVDPPRGFLDLDLDIQGPPEAPIMDGRFVLHDVEVDGTHLSRVEGTLDYREQLARTELFADLDGRRLLTLTGRVPANLSFQEVEDRFPDRRIEVSAQVDSFPAASALAFLDVLEDVEGTLDGRVELRGTFSELRPSGDIALQGGAFALPELGVRLTDIGGTVTLREDQTIEVDAEVRARGPARIAGTIGLQDLMDPTFDLRITASNFQAVDRRDLNARVGGEVTLTGRYQRPQVGGDVRVEQGTIFVEEFARTAEVVDLTDPAFFDVVDTTLVAARPALEAAQNPFVQNLRVDVDLGIQRDVWLRSREMNVEIGGDLIVTFDRPRREILLVGTLEAIRGSYSAFGRTFQVQEGVVEFVGTPGIDPALDIQAVHRLRREGGEPLDIVANVGGSLTNLRVDLTSEAQPPIAQSDLISYLIFGRPSFALASGETSILEGAAGVGVGVGVGAIATQLGQVVAQQFGLDYFTITQTREAGGLESAAGLSGTFADTQIEVGQYVADNLFLALILRPLTGLGARTQTQFPGARLEWRFTDLWTAEAFIEDRFAREAASGFGELGLRMDKVLGFSLYREWGY